MTISPLMDHHKSVDWTVAEGAYRESGAGSRLYLLTLSHPSTLGYMQPWLYDRFFTQGSNETAGAGRSSHRPEKAQSQGGRAAGCKLGGRRKAAPTAAADTLRGAVEKGGIKYWQ
ncbi:unnamed protein product [Chrysoparadoxa australica]